MNYSTTPPQGAKELKESDELFNIEVKLMYTPASTYRMQLNSHFTFAQAEKILPYLKKLGISWVYLSPIMQANPGSTHGYDVSNPNQINEELGGVTGFNEFSHRLTALNMGLLLDFVPNHMAATEHNPWWQDVVSHGAVSKYSYLFDIFWNLSSPEKLLYRRFFDINELICLRVEDPAVFKQTHQLLLQLVSNQQVNGIRLDHIDGLKNPNAYLDLLTQELNQPLYLIVEKILARYEKLPASWKIAGTTGYDFLNELNQIFVNPTGFKHLIDFYDYLIESKLNIAEVRNANNKLVIERLFQTEFSNLINSLHNIASCRLDSPERAEIERLLVEFCAAIPVYRSYIQGYAIDPQDKTILTGIFKEMRKKSIPSAYLEFFENCFTPPHPDAISEKEKNLWSDWVARWQVFTGPMVAKGYEDTSCYQFNPLLSLNEVGSDPQYFNPTQLGDLTAFHNYNQCTQLHYPHRLNATSTHDTKHSEDVRARLNVLTEIPQEWQQSVMRWRQWNQAKKMVKNAQNIPDMNDELMLYQTLLGAWPLDPAAIPQFKIHLRLFLEKAEREAKVHSSWQNPNPDYEQALIAFCDQLLIESEENQFLPDFIQLQQKLAFFGMLNSLSQLALKITCPGVPDLYQGNEIWQFNLVDPDNRRVIDFKPLTALLDSLQAAASENTPEFLRKLLACWADGQIKLYVTYKLLNFRRDHAELFSSGLYIPLQATGSKSDYVISFMRRHHHQWLLVAVPRWCTRLCAVNQPPLAAAWEDTRIILPPDAPENWQALLTNDRISSQKQELNFLSAAAIFNQFPLGIYEAS